MKRHPLLEVLIEAAHASFPSPDGEVTFLPVHRPGIEAIVAFTGHAFVMSDLEAADFDDMVLDGLIRGVPSSVFDGSAVIGSSVFVD